MSEIVIATKNKGKIKEIKSFFKGAPGIKWLTFKDFNSFPDVEESGGSFMENARLKAKKIAEYTNKLTLADDSGLEVYCLNGRPGVKSSRYAGLSASDKDNRLRLLDELKDVERVFERRARFVCFLVLRDPQKGPVFETCGVCEGFIGKKEVGSGGFGYDCIFIPKSHKKTMAQLSQREKNRISHRGKALSAFFTFIENF